jgi:hypothetical protein
MIVVGPRILLPGIGGCCLGQSPENRAIRRYEEVRLIRRVGATRERHRIRHSIRYRQLGHGKRNSPGAVDRHQIGLGLQHETLVLSRFVLELLFRSPWCLAEGVAAAYQRATGREVRRRGFETGVAHSPGREPLASASLISLGGMICTRDARTSSRPGEVRARQTPGGPGGFAGSPEARGSRLAARSSQLWAGSSGQGIRRAVVACPPAGRDRCLRLPASERATPSRIACFGRCPTRVTRSGRWWSFSLGCNAFPR